MYSKRLGFTLIEILVVISILGILLSIVAYSGTTARDTAKQTKAESSVEQLGLSLQLYREVVGEFPPGDDNCSLCSLLANNYSGAVGEWELVVAALSPNYIDDSIAADPWGNPYAYDNNYGSASNGLYTVLCSMGPNEEFESALDFATYTIGSGNPVAQGDDICFFTQ